MYEGDEEVEVRPLFYAEGNLPRHYDNFLEHYNSDNFVDELHHLVAIVEMLASVNDVLIWEATLYFEGVSK
jgi:hypothetical protein